MFCNMRIIIDRLFSNRRVASDSAGGRGARDNNGREYYEQGYECNNYECKFNAMNKLTLK